MSYIHKKISLPKLAGFVVCLSPIYITNIAYAAAPSTTISCDSSNNSIRPCESSSVIIGRDSWAVSQGVALGKSAGSVGDKAIAIGGEKPTAFGNSAIAIGSTATSLPRLNSENKPVSLSDGPIDYGLALGNLAKSSGHSISVGGNATSLGKGSMALGAYSTTANKDYEKYIAKSQFIPYSEAWKDYLKKQGIRPGIDTEKEAAIDAEIRTYYKDYMDDIEYDKRAPNDSNWAQQVMVALRYQYIFEVKERQPSYATAIGSWSYTTSDYGLSVGASAKTTSTGGVALGAFSEAHRNPLTANDNNATSAPFSGVDLTDNTKQQLYGAVSIGAPADEENHSPVILRQLINLADGTEDTDAVNLRQLRAAFNSASGNAGNLDTIVGDNNITVTPTSKEGNPDKKQINITLNENIHVKSVDTGTVRVDNIGVSIKEGPSMTAQGIDANNTRITNVAPGRPDTNDAVNMRQLGELRKELKNDISYMGEKMRKMKKEMRGIGANATAIASLPQVMHAGKSQIAASTGIYRDATAVAIGWSHASQDGRKIIKLNGAINSNGDGTAGIGFGYEY